MPGPCVSARTGTAGMNPAFTARLGARSTLKPRVSYERKPQRFPLIGPLNGRSRLNFRRTADPAGFAALLTFPGMGLFKRAGAHARSVCKRACGDGRNESGLHCKAEREVDSQATGLVKVGFFSTIRSTSPHSLACSGVMKKSRSIARSTSSISRWQCLA